MTVTSAVEPGRSSNCPIRGTSAALWTKFARTTPSNEPTRRVLASFATLSARHVSVRSSFTGRRDPSLACLI